MRKAFLLTSFSLVMPVALILIILSLVYLSYLKQQLSTPVTSATPSRAVVYAALPTIQNISNVEITQEDARIEMVRQFFARYNSPLEPYAKDVVYYADLYSLDFRIVPSIAMQESNLCLKAPVDSNNCWGFGIYGGNIKKFDSYPEGIQTVTLDDFVAEKQIKNIDLIKMDAERSEDLILKGAHKTLSSGIVPRIICEIPSSAKPLLGDKVRNIFYSYGYRSYILNTMLSRKKYLSELKRDEPVVGLQNLLFKK